jgi:Tfp pilus assembly protein PilO
MNLSKASVKGLGVLVSGALLFSTGIFVINPLLEQRSGNISELKSKQQITETKKANLARLSKGAVNFEEAFKAGSNFEKIVPKDKNIESASRAISEALVPGVTITSFTFNSEEAVAPNALPKASLEGYKPPASFAKSTSKSGSSAPAKPAAGGSSTLNRLPMTITVGAESYQKLSEYIDQLAKRDRLLSVISISAGSKDGIIKADIYAYAFIDKSQ